MPRSLFPAVLLVDGYNIIGAWPCLKKTRDDLGLEAARWELVETMTSYSSFQGYETQIVFDAQYHKAPTNQEIITEFLSVHYTDFGQTADTYIEKSCASMRHQRAQSLISRVIVATSDRAQQLMVQGYGAEWLSAQQLCSEVESTVCQMQHKYQKRKQSKGRFLANSIDAKARQRLAELRRGP
ncbi:NYN domain-containing protein [Umezakia ovalisporum]|jgi:predicted RNA-binding protein with PIN domain|uniref:NYN domain-containing protein n=2 Tax=Umezakia ovalisporum TaxID=75695 RepID=A0AA43GZN2_9CYAN|nr:NYN domain-containing protein [Umezakia ovalisporum]MBI1242402.1 NYN domain-containing protein [Nostoc sp. RI_552]MDH6057476.1 NYN domain-containing protein [Umezakia ovalisporum FSS-43]MDH6064684.1 NYN domain-containing protein [Umezakia ovalisporum FSS-62]MDH6069043.1 NYN domain-containing protein [Umezakia ovalisporum APH033B]MDH6069411.1 NYN domain-containing protein [Umezakia ovalisporum CobakiLakeA]